MPNLVLSRQPKESVIIVVPPSDGPTTIEVHQVAILGDKSKLSFTAPSEVRIDRREVYDAIRRENRRAAAVKPGDVQPLR